MLTATPRPVPRREASPCHPERGPGWLGPKASPSPRSRARATEEALMAAEVPEAAAAGTPRLGLGRGGMALQPSGLPLGSRPRSEHLRSVWVPHASSSQGASAQQVGRPGSAPACPPEGDIPGPSFPGAGRRQRAPARPQTPEWMASALPRLLQWPPPPGSAGAPVPAPRSGLAFHHWTPSGPCTRSVCPQVPL